MGHIEIMIRTHELWRFAALCCLVACGSGETPASQNANGHGGASGAGGSGVIMMPGGDGGPDGRTMTTSPDSGVQDGATGAGEDGDAGPPFDSRPAMDGGRDGAADRTGDGPNAPSDASTGADSGFSLHTCPSQPDPPCPAKVRAGDVVAYNGSDVAMLRGVTEIQGYLKIFTGEELDSLSCLKRVGTDVSINLSSPKPMTLWGLRNLEFVGDSVFIRSFDEAHVDCGLRRLASLGTKYLTGGSVDINVPLIGELDLSQITQVTHIRIADTRLTRVTLPSSVALAMGQIWFERNADLAAISGFDGISLTRHLFSVDDIDSLRIVDNPKLPMCRAQQFQGFFQAAGFPQSTIHVSGNAPCAR